MLEKQRDVVLNEIASLSVPRSITSQDNGTDYLRRTAEDLLYGKAAIGYNLFSQGLIERCAEIVEVALECNLVSSAVCSVILWEKTCHRSLDETLVSSIRGALSEIVIPEPRGVLDYLSHNPHLFEIDNTSLTDRELLEGLVGMGEAEFLFWPRKPRLHFSTQCIFTKV